MGQRIGCWVGEGSPYFITSLSEGSSEVMSRVMRSRCLVDIRGNGADVSRPRMGLMSLLMSVSLPLLVFGFCSLSKAGMLFWPRYLAGAGTSESSTVVAASGSEQCRGSRSGGPPPPLSPGRTKGEDRAHIPKDLDQPSCCLFSSLWPPAAAPGDRVLLRPADLAVWVDSLLLEDARWFGLYEQSWGCSLLMQFAHGSRASHLTLRCLHGQHAVPGSGLVEVDVQSITRHGSDDGDGAGQPGR